MEQVSAASPIKFQFEPPVTPRNYLDSKRKKKPPPHKYGVTVLSHFCNSPKSAIVKGKSNQTNKKVLFPPQTNSCYRNSNLINRVSTEPILSDPQLKVYFPLVAPPSTQQAGESPQIAIEQVITEYSRTQPLTSLSFYQNSYVFLLTDLIQRSETLVKIYRNKNFDFLSDTSYTAQREDLMDQETRHNSAKCILRFINKIFQIIESEFDNKPNQLQRLMNCIEWLNPSNQQNKIDHTVILFLLGMYITPKGIFFNIDYQFPNSSELPTQNTPKTTFERIFFFQIPSEVITCLIEIGYKPFETDYRSIARSANVDQRKKLLEITTHVTAHSHESFQILKNSKILNDIISNQDWNILEFAIQLGAQPILSEESSIDTTIEQLRHLLQTTSLDCLIPVKTSEILLDKVNFLNSFLETCWSFVLKYHFHEDNESWEFFLKEIDLLILEFKTPI